MTDSSASGDMFMRAAAPSVGTVPRERYGRHARRACWHRNSIVAAALICGDVVAALAAAASGDLLTRAAGLQASPLGPPDAVLLVLASAVAGLYGRTGLGLYERFKQRTMVVGWFVLLVSLLAFPLQHPGDFAVVMAWQAFNLLVIGHYIDATTRALLARLGLWGASTVLVGGGKACRRLVHLLAGRPELGLTPVGLIATGEDPVAARPPVPVIGSTNDFCAIRPPFDIEVAIFATARDLAAVPAECQAFAPSCRFLLAENVRDVQTLWLRTRMLGPLVGIEIRRDLCRRHNRALKRAFDLLVSIPLGILLLPVIALAALAIRMVDPGPAFYVQKRLGRNGRIVRVLKLRTMHLDSERRLEEHLRRDPQARIEWQRFFKLRHDPRILPLVGNFIRKSSLDELPQIWNVIRGDMSLVGPRPLPAYHVEKLDAEFQTLRTCVTPGITGLWQISSRSDGDLRVLKEHDLFYIRNWSLWLDVYILLQTVPAVLSAKGAR